MTLDRVFLYKLFKHQEINSSEFPTEPNNRGTTMANFECEVTRAKCSQRPLVPIKAFSQAFAAFERSRAPINLDPL